MSEPSSQSNRPGADEETPEPQAEEILLEPLDIGKSLEKADGIKKDVGNLVNREAGEKSKSSNDPVYGPDGTLQPPPRSKSRWLVITLFLVVVVVTGVAYVVNRLTQVEVPSQGTPPTPAVEPNNGPLALPQGVDSLVCEAASDGGYDLQIPLLQRGDKKYRIPRDVVIEIDPKVDVVDKAGPSFIEASLNSTAQGEKVHLKIHLRSNDKRANLLKQVRPLLLEAE